MMTGLFHGTWWNQHQDAALLRGDPTSYLNTDHLRDGARFEPIADFTPNEKFGLAELIHVALRPAQTAP